MFDAKCCEGERESALEIRQVLRSAASAGGQVCNRTHSLVASAKTTPALGGAHGVILCVGSWTPACETSRSSALAQFQQ